MLLAEYSTFNPAKTASKVARELAILHATARNDALTAIYKDLKKEKRAIPCANAEDVASATTAVKMFKWRIERDYLQEARS